MAKRKSILAIDDIHEDLRLLVALLQREGYRVRHTRNSLRGLATAQTELPDLILLDMKMSGIDGFEICRRLKADERTREIPVLFLSALTDIDDRARGFQLGAVDYITKPIEETELLARVNTHIALRSLLQHETEMERHRALARMVAGLAHELNTPLAIANTAADIIANRLPMLAKLLPQDPIGARDVEKTHQAIDLLMRNIAHAHRLVQNFKKFSANQLVGATESILLVQTIIEVVDLFRLNAYQSHLAIDIQSSLAADTVWVGYPGYLAQVLMNLLSNVERYAYPEGGAGRVVIEIACTHAEQQPAYALTVRDWGQGMLPEHVSRIFEPFFTTGRVQGGTGLGMTIVHNIVIDIFKGYIQVESEPGQGTSVHLSFPKTLS